MNSLYDFIVEPSGSRYKNTKKVGDKELILNTSVEEYKCVNKEGLVKAIPAAIKTPIEVGDRVMIHHNVFRRFYNVKGKEQNSRSYFKEDLYFCGIDQVYLYNKGCGWKTVLNRCFVKPIKSLSNYKIEDVEPNMGVLRYGNANLDKSNIKEGDLVSFPSRSKWEFIVDNELLYCMKSKNIISTHEYEGNETEYNPSWAQGS